LNLSSGSQTSPPVWQIALALGALYLIWGAIYLAVRVAVHFWPPFLLMGARFFLAGGLILLWARLRGTPWPTERREWLSAGTVGLLMVTGANGGVAWGVERVDSGLAAVLIATVPLWLIVLESLRPGGDRPHVSALVGLGLGLVGVAVLVRPNVGVAENVPVLLGQVALLGAALMWALGSIGTRYFRMPSSFSMGTSLQMLVGGLFLSLIGLAKGELGRVPNTVALKPALAFLFMAFFGSIVAYSAYQWLIRSTRPALVATYAYVNPVVAVLLGALLAGEPLTSSVLLGSALVITSAFLIQRVRS